jgi:hypothetical protein
VSGYITHAQRNAIRRAAEARKTPAERETERRIAAWMREAFPQPWDVAPEDDADESSL